MFIDFSLKDFIDILSVAFLLYYSYKLMKASGSIHIFTGILMFILLWLPSSFAKRPALTKSSWRQSVWDRVKLLCTPWSISSS